MSPDAATRRRARDPRWAAALALVLALGGADAGAASGTVTVPRLPGTCPGGVQPGALGSSLAGLRQAVGLACSDPRSCQPAEQIGRALDQAFDAVCAGQPSRALSQAARALQQIERSPLLAAVANLQQWTSILLDAAAEEAALARDELDAEIARLCASARSQQGKGLGRIDQGLERAELALESGPASGALQELSRALQGIESAQKSIASSASRCWPRACRGMDPAAFRAGAAGNPALELVPVDRGTVARYRIRSSGSFGELSGELRLAFDSASRARVTGYFEPTDPPDFVTATGDFSTQSCVDAHGWLRFSSASERFQFSTRNLGRSQVSSNLRFAPAIGSLPATFFIPAVPQAATLRVGDELAVYGFVLEGTIGNERGRGECSVWQRVVAIEELRVEAGSFEAARVESTFQCNGADPLEWTTWLVDDVGFARIEVQDADGLYVYELACFSAPGGPAPGAPACALEDPRAPRATGAGLEVHGIGGGTDLSATLDQWVVSP